MRNKKLFKPIFIFLMIFVVLLFVAGYFMENSPRQGSGNGNPAGFFGLLLAILFPLVVLSFVLIFNKVKARNLSLFATILLTALYIYLGYNHQKESYFMYKKIIKQRMLDSGLSSDLVYINDILKGFSIYLNSQFFNINTYLMYMSAVLFVAAILYVIYKKVLRWTIKSISR